MTSYWFLKSESEAYSWDDLVKDGKTSWTGVRNFQARNNLNAMKVGDKGVRSLHLLILMRQQKKTTQQ